MSAKFPRGGGGRGAGPFLALSLISIRPKLDSGKRVPLPIHLKLTYHLKLGTKCCCHCLATVLCSVNLAILNCIVFVFVYMLMCQYGFMHYLNDIHLA